MVIEGDNFDSLRLLRATHAGKVRVIYIDPPYNTGNKDWVYNDKFVGANDRWRHSQWLEFLYQRLTLARELLTSDGVILVSINDENRSRLDERQWLADKTHTLEDGVFCQGQFDDTWFGNTLETAFSRALDGADFVEWWHRNPRNKPYAVKVVRAEHENYFYPDFVVCVRHTATDVPLPRLMETKDDTKDAARKAQHSPAGYGKVLFLTPDGKDRMRWVKDDGSLGDVLALDSMPTALHKLAATRPSVCIT